MNCPNCGGTKFSHNNVCRGCGFFLNQLPEGSLLHDKYEIKKAIKAGGMGAVYLGFDVDTKRKCAIKQMFIQEQDEELNTYVVKRFLEEARLLSELAHPSIPRVTDHFNEEGHYYMIMDFIEGRDLFTYLENNGGKPVEEDKVVKWTFEMCDVLNYLHSRPRPIVHRDINPTNLILRDKDNRLLLVDFGFARPVNPKLRNLKTAVGTQTYAAPEQISGYPEPRSDQYSLAATMHFLLTGKESNPFNFIPIRKINPKVSQDMEDVIMKALNLDMEKRYPSAKEMSRDLMLKRGKIEEEEEEEPKEVILTTRPVIKLNKPSRPAPQVKAPLSFQKENKNEEFIEIPIERNYDEEPSRIDVKENNKSRPAEKKKGFFGAIIEKIMSLFKK